jgi:hypothetical protein
MPLGIIEWMAAKRKTCILTGAAAGIATGVRTRSVLALL